MTYSLCARCPRSGQLGVAAMTHMLGVGKIVAHAGARVGAAASQAFMNPYLAIDGLARLAAGESAEPVVNDLVEADPGRSGRQFGLVDARGGAAAFTGEQPEDWKGHRTGEGWACQGNRLAGPQVVDAAVDAFLDRPDDALVDRLVAALDAGESAGGDTLGHRSATVAVVDTEAYPLWDIRIDHADRPLEELHRMYEAFAEHLIDEIRILPTRDDPIGGMDFTRPDDSV